MYESKKKYFYGTGRRKSSVARVRVYENGTGSIIINGRDINDYFGLETLKLVVRQPLVTTELVDKVDVVVSVCGGGVSGQAGAIRHGIARALLTVNPEYRASLKAAGFLTRDPRKKEVRLEGRPSGSSVLQEITGPRDSSPAVSNPGNLFRGFFNTVEQTENASRTALVPLGLFYAFSLRNGQ